MLKNPIEDNGTANIAVPSRGATVEFDNVLKDYDGFRAVDRFSLAVREGEFLTLLGPSGSGKTTLLNMIAGFLDPTSGEILISGRPITSTPTEKRNVGMVFQNYSLFPNMTVEQNIAFPLKMRKVNPIDARKHVDTALGLVGLANLGQRYPAQLSGGQKQRIAFARAIVFKPRVLLMDEPLGALDLKLRERMQVEIVKYRKEVGCTVIYVTHDQSEALSMSDRIVVMNEGSAVQIGTPLEIYDRPNSRFVANFVGEMNMFSLNRAAGDLAQIAELGASISISSEQMGTALCVRPEKIRRMDVRSPNAAVLEDDWVLFDATIEELLFSGDTQRITAKCRSGHSVSFKEARSESLDKGLAVGQRLQLGFRARNAIVLGN